MENLEIYEKMKALAESATMSDEDKALIVDTCKELGIEFRPSSRCKNCYRDAATQCAIALKKAAGMEEVSAEGLRLKKGVDILVNGSRLNEATLTPEWLDWLLSSMPEWWIRQYFDGYED